MFRILKRPNFWIVLLGDYGVEGRRQRTDDRGRRTEGGGQVGGGLTLKVLRKHIKRLVNYAEAGDGGKIREELKRVVPEYRPEDGRQRTDDGGRRCNTNGNGDDK